MSPELSDLLRKGNATTFIVSGEQFFSWASGADPKEVSEENFISYVSGGVMGFVSIVGRVAKYSPELAQKTLGIVLTGSKYEEGDAFSKKLNEWSNSAPIDERMKRKALVKEIMLYRKAFSILRRKLGDKRYFSLINNVLKVMHNQHTILTSSGKNNPQDASGREGSNKGSEEREEEKMAREEEEEKYASIVEETIQNLLKKVLENAELKELLDRAINCCGDSIKDGVKPRAG